MDSGIKFGASRLKTLAMVSGCGLVTLATLPSALSWPSTDENTQGAGCITTTSGGEGDFSFYAQWNLQAQSYAGHLLYTDSQANVSIDTTVITDYSSLLGPYARGFVVGVSNPAYNEARVIVSDNGSVASDDSFELQLLLNGNIVYQQGNALNDSCGGGISIVAGSPSPSPNPNPPPVGQCDDFYTGGGWIIGTPTKAKANFGVHGGIKNGALWGGLNYIDHGMRMHVKSTELTAYTALTPIGRQLNFNVTMDGQPGTAIVQLYDNGEPGRNDTFSIQLSNGYSASGDLGGTGHGGGNLQFHQGKCDQSPSVDKGDHKGGNGGNSGNGNSKNSNYGKSPQGNSGNCQNGGK
jgi:hypothetical protein